uniref:Uncharacterized protein n=1 Tax=uncultured marine virus TaxID=186617 RepID=A0A0F7L6K8_9VIRU|nr:hypothetical protein [uncultured marine virus]
MTARPALAFLLPLLRLRLRLRLLRPPLRYWRLTPGRLAARREGSRTIRSPSPALI